MDANQTLKAYELRCLALDVALRAIECCVEAGKPADQFFDVARSLATGLSLDQPPRLHWPSHVRPDRAD